MTPSPNSEHTNTNNDSSSTVNRNSKACHWAVVGGGMMGLVAALRLAERGERVTLIESSSSLGGLTSSWELGARDACDEKESAITETVEWDKFYHVVLLSDSRIRSIFSMLGLDEEIQWVQTKTGFYSEGKLYPLSSSIDFLKFPPLNLYQKFRLGSTIFLGSKIRNWRSMEGMLVGDWLQRWSGKSTYQKIWKPLLKAKLGMAYERTAASFIWAYIDRMYKARRSGMKRELFGYVPGGYKRIIDGLEKHLKNVGVTIIKNAPVQLVVPNASSNRTPLANAVASADGASIEISFGADSDLKQLSFDRVIMTSPYRVIESSCPWLTTSERQKLSSTEYLGVVCTSLLMDKPLTGYYVTNIIDEWVPLTGIIEMGSILPPEKLGGNYLVYLPQYMLSNDSRLYEPDEVVHERCLATLERMYPEKLIRQSVKSIQTARASFVMALPTLNFSESRPPVLLSQTGVYLLNSARIVKGTLNVNETLELLEEEFNGVIWPNHLMRLNQS